MSEFIELNEDELDEVDGGGLCGALLGGLIGGAIGCFIAASIVLVSYATDNYSEKVQTCVDAVVTACFCVGMVIGASSPTP